MTSAAPWGALPQSQGLVRSAEQAVEKIEDHIPLSSENGLPEKDQSGSSTQTDTSSDLEKIGSTQEVEKLARQFTQQSTTKQPEVESRLRRLNTSSSVKTNGGGYRNSFLDPSDPALDPASGQFKPERWVRTLIGLQSRDTERYPQRVAGVAYRNLNVHGFGSLTDYQKCVRTEGCLRW